ncbi:MAG TPA: hypothetical protein VG815_10350, partial [Chloroflexota bacterium]|nr:hypothetical protein [Chloroflexota bacterium]
MDPTGVANPAGRDPSPLPRRRHARPQKRPTRTFERSHYEAGLEFVAGVDEVGRGCLAGPVLAAAVILPVDPARLRAISGVRDSKVLKADDRDRLYDRIMTVAVATGVGLASHAFIDRYGIAPASRVAMAKAVGRLGQTPEHVL